MNCFDININLLSRIAEGDSEAFRIFYDNNYIKIYRFTSYYIKRHEVKEEVISDVFFSVWENRKKLTEVEDINSLLYVMTRNKALDYISSSKESISIDQIPIGIVSKDLIPSDNLINKELNFHIQAAIEDLPKRCKVIFLMAKEEGLKYKDISKILGLSEKTVNAQMVIALKRLRDALRKHLFVLLVMFFMLSHVL